MNLLSPRAAPALLAHGSAALLLGALAFQHWGGLQPCVLCLWQRWPHVVAIAAGFVGMFLIRQGRRVPAGWATLVAAGACYLASIPFSVLRQRKAVRAAAAEHGQPGNGA